MARSPTAPATRRRSAVGGSCAGACVSCLPWTDIAVSRAPVERDPYRRMIARPLASADIAIDACACQPRCQRRTQKEMIDAKARVALECVAQIFPERVDALPRMRRADGIDPTLRDQLAKSFAHLGPEQSVVHP